MTSWLLAPQWTNRAAAGSVFATSSVSALTTASRLYRSAGFAKVEEKPGRMWGVDVVEEKYELALA